MSESLSNKKREILYIKKETPTQVFSGQFFEISRNTYFLDNLGN